ncbi:MAG: hypothetical protein H7070_08510 [Saprospiraceae bacterium]|nr:hypothetical protein [Pyrinomonadaceae bacterium]
MNAYHGTDKNSSIIIVGPPASVDVTRGGGELGRGFYVGDSLALAASFAVGKFGSNSAVVKFEIDESAFLKLKTLIIKRRGLVWRKWRFFKRKSVTSKYLFGVDVVCSPFATIDMACQFKFESLSAQNVLNHHSDRKSL